MSATKKNKVKFGLKNVHVAPEIVSDEGVISYGTPEAVPGAVNMTLSVEGDNSPFYADNIVYYRALTNNGYSGDLEFALVPDWFKQKYLKEIKDGNGVQVESSLITEFPAFALMFQFEGDKKAVRHVMYHCTASRPSVEGETKQGSTTPKTETVNITADPRPDGLVKARSTEDTASAVYTNWFNQVYVPSLTPEQMAGEEDVQTPARLATLTIGSLSLTPAFDASTTVYTATTSNATNTITATGADGATAAITVNGSAHTSGQSATWNTGTNTVQILVTKEGCASTTYTVTVTKPAAE